ncbi:MAG: CoB--CoM heterodisulfide reductase iron-sulfur subunit B family protein [Nitrospinae bacterium]|nr:CoB--CoM heterodisulfide reductase iron-sulfur subunit B family protein [Nitrospinota bacterium]MBF0633053.1 CoB--CoM heterodisulfide reductase iron-sulfur subunit B family protein [Nitrospinota bacterium]
MKYALYTGCVAKGAGRELLAATNVACAKLGIELVEMTAAACCGAGVISEDNPMLADILNARTFAQAEEMGLPIMNICTTCQGVHRKAQIKLKKDPAYLERVNKELKEQTGLEYKGTVKVRHFYEVLLEEYGLDKLKSKITRPLNGYKVAAFYGCYAMRPHEYSDLQNPDNPDELEKIIIALGATPIDYAERLKCCGFPILMMNKTNAMKLTGNALIGAKGAGADAVVTPCPLCHLNLDAYQPEVENMNDVELKLPVLHIPQLVALALGASYEELRLKTHIVRPPAEIAG